MSILVQKVQRVNSAHPVTGSIVGPDPSNESRWLVAWPGQQLGLDVVLLWESAADLIGVPSISAEVAA